MSQRTPDQQFSHYVKIAMAVFSLCFIYFVIADLFMPMTPQARVFHRVTQITPQVSGPITKVWVHNNQTVQQGDVFFEIDSVPYLLAREKAELALQDVALQNQQLDARIATTKADITGAKATVKEYNNEYQRAKALVASNVISQQRVEGIEAQLLRACASVKSLNAELTRLQVARGERNSNNLALKQAQNSLNSAELNVTYTKIAAPHSGVISNMQVTPGTFAKQSVPLSALVAKELDLVADFREKSLRYVNKNEHAQVVFDAFPGQVFTAIASEFEAGVRDGQLAADGTLAGVEKSNRWVRDAQRQRVHFRLIAPPEALQKLNSGARATVQILPDNTLLNMLAKLQIRFVSYLHYIY